MNQIFLLRLLVFVSLIGVFFSGIIIFLLMSMFKKQTESLEAAANKVEEVKLTLEASSHISVEKMDALAKEKTLQQLQEKAAIGSEKIDQIAAVALNREDLV
jgi:uncharacterized protein (UPF0333 family)